jgi:coatomer protein complex subunit gamma
MTPDNDDVSLVEKVLIPAPQLVYDVPGVAYVAYERTILDDYPECKFLVWLPMCIPVSTVYDVIYIRY